MKKAVLSGTIILLVILAFATFSSWDVLVHQFMPNPSSSEWDWRNHFAPFKPARRGYSVLIDLDSLTLRLYEDTEEIRAWPVSGGSKETPSPTGAWMVTEIGDWGREFGGSWIALNVPWGKYGIHGTLKPWVVGSNNVSHGCIRMKNKDVSELKQYMSVGVPVYVKYDNAPFRIIWDGKVGSDVLELQIILKLLGYYEGEPDGSFGNETFKAVCQFQTDEQLTADGVIGQQSWNILWERVKKLRR